MAPVSELVSIPVHVDLAEALQALSAASGLPVHTVLDRVLSSTQRWPDRNSHGSPGRWIPLAFVAMTGLAAATAWCALSRRER